MCCHHCFSLARWNSVFFSSSDKPPLCFWCPQISFFIWLYLSTSERIRWNSSSVILSSFRATEIWSAIVFSFDSARPRIKSCFLAFAWSLRPANFPPTPSSPHTIAPAWKPTSTGTAMTAIQRQKQPSSRWSPKALSIPSAKLARASTFYTVRLWSLVLFWDGIWPQPHAEGGEFLRSQVAGRGSSCNKVRPDHPLNGLLANDDSGLFEWELTGRK